jgi:hypothetical protein
VKRPSYRHAVGWIAANDEPNEMDEGVVYEMISVILIADIFMIDPLKVAKDVVARRQAALDAGEPVDPDEFA